MKTIIKQLRNYDSKLVKSIFWEANEECFSVSKRFFNNQRNILLIAYRKDIPCGFLYAYLLDSLNSDQPKMFLYSIDVFNNYKRSGIGSRLLTRLKQISKRHNCSEIFVLTNRSNTPAMRFYGKTGGIKENKDDVMFVYPFPSTKRAQNSKRR